MAEYRPEATSELISALTKGDGYGKLRGVVNKKICAGCREELLARAEGQNWDNWPGVKSKRVKDPLEWGGSSFTDLLNQTASTVRPVMEAVLGPSPWLTSFHALVLFPEPALTNRDVERLCQAGLHSDFPYGEFKEKMDRALLGPNPKQVEGRPMGHGKDGKGWVFPSGFKPGERGAPHTIQTIWILDLFTPERGATQLLPGSCHWQSVPNCGPGPDWDRFSQSAVPQTGVSGDILFYIGATWHTIAVNRARGAAAGPRVALLGQWSSHFMCPLEAHVWTTPSWVRKRLSPDAAALLGLPGHVPGISEVSRAPHRDQAPRFLRDSARFALDTVMMSYKIFLGPVVGIAFMWACICAQFSWHACLIFAPGAILAGFIGGVHLTLRRLQI